MGRVPARLQLALIVLAACAFAAVIGVLLAARPEQGVALTDGWAGAIRPPGLRVPDFALRDQDGKPVRLSDYRGRTVLVTFMYSTCRDTCPLTAQQIKGALDDLGHDVPTLAVSVDPANDTRDSAEAFLVKRGLSGGRMHFLLGTRAQLAPIWHAYGIQPQGNGFEHTARVLVIDKDGRQRVAFPVEQLVDRDLAHDIRKLEAEPA